MWSAVYQRQPAEVTGNERLSERFIHHYHINMYYIRGTLFLSPSEDRFVLSGGI
jgi:hypothetical protein